MTETRVGGVLRFEHTFDIHFYETGRDGCLTPVALFNYLQEMAVRHGESVGMTAERQNELGYLWMMNRLHLQVKRYPDRSAPIRIATWASNFDGLYATREWLATDSTGNVFARGTGRWIVIDAERRKIVRIPMEIAEPYGLSEGRALEDSFERMSPLESAEHARAFHVRASELDTNQHANSATYVDWTLESVPTEVWENHSPTGIEILFKKECKLGDAVVSRSRTSDSSSNESCFLHDLRLDGSNAVVAVGRTRWTANDN